MLTLRPRVRCLNHRPPIPTGEYVLYWMTAARRPFHNFALERAVLWACELGRPLVVLEALRVDSPWANARHHRFVLDGMAANAAAFARSPVTYLPYVEPTPGAGKGLLAALAEQAAVVVADDAPVFFLPRALAAAARQVRPRLEAVDSNGLLPLSTAPRAWPTAHSFRRLLQRALPDALPNQPAHDPLAGIALPRLDDLPRFVTDRWPLAVDLDRSAALETRLPIDQTVRPTALRGGHIAAVRCLDRFVAKRLARYDKRNQPEGEVTSGLSPYLHYGHISAHEVFAEVAGHEGWTPERLKPRTDGARTGFWGMSAAAEGFLDQLITWRELGYQFCHAEPRYDRFDTLPDWAKRTLAAHRGDPRPVTYDLATFEQAATHDPLWNAAQTQLVTEGTIHNYLRMLWGKKVLHWTRTPEEALSILIHLNNKYALDGRDPNSYSGIFWVFGRFDRAFGPERPVFGTVRYMTSRSTATKYRVKGYLARHGGAPAQGRLALD